MESLFTSPILAQQAEKYWLSLCERHPEHAAKDNIMLQNRLRRAMALSDFLADVFLRYPQWIEPLLTDDRLENQQLDDYSAALAAQLVSVNDEASFLESLRRFRQYQMARIALADFDPNAVVETTLARLSNLADAFITEALAWIVRYFEPQWGQAKFVDGQVMPLVVLGMGKLGGRELNFSSDIDLIFCYQKSGETIGGRRALDHQQYFTRIGQKLIAALDQKTIDGFVYRVDMRLRPFGDSGPLVLSFSALEDYYQEQGREWERYAMLKARPIGTHPSHQLVTDLLRPFVFRRYIDFGVIDSLRNMKKLIGQEVRRRRLVDNLKLSAGGIREIEFIVQAFQLIRGGRLTELQHRQLLTVLPRLNAHGMMADEQVSKLRQAYIYLRRLENLIQAFADKQTQQMPETALDQARLCEITGQASYNALQQQCHAVMAKVHQEFNWVIGDEDEGDESNSDRWQGVFQRLEDADESRDYITQVQPDWPVDNIYKILLDFKLDSKKRVAGRRGHQVLEKLMPYLLQRLAVAAQIESTLHAVLQVLLKICSRTAYLELLLENKGALNQLVILCEKSQWIADHLARYPILLDELIDPKLLQNTPQLSDYQPALQQQLLRVSSDDLELQMETLRQFKQSSQLHIAAADISGLLTTSEVSDHLTALAEAIIAQVVHLAWQQMRVKYGEPRSARAAGHYNFGVVAYGKCGGIETSYSSDLDLVFIHDANADEQTDGEREVSAQQFYLKLSQRILHLFNTRTASGILYEVDMRLRPSGNAGLLVVHRSTFAQYQQQDAWTWEHQALVRARMVFGNDQLKQQFEKIRLQILQLPRDLTHLRQQVCEMREKMRAHLDTSTAEQIDLKQTVGGLTDIEFIAQYLILGFAHQLSVPYIVSDNVRLFALLATAGVISETERHCLTTTYFALRDRGHQLALQNQPAVVASDEFQQERQAISAIWQKVMEQTNKA